MHSSCAPPVSALTTEGSTNPAKQGASPARSCRRSHGTRRSVSSPPRSAYGGCPKPCAAGGSASPLPSTSATTTASSTPLRASLPGTRDANNGSWNTWFAVTRANAVQVVDQFIKTALPRFGDFLVRASVRGQGLFSVALSQHQQNVSAVGGRATHSHNDRRADDRRALRSPFSADRPRRDRAAEKPARHTAITQAAIVRRAAVPLIASQNYAASRNAMASFRGASLGRPRREAEKPDSRGCSRSVTGPSLRHVRFTSASGRAHRTSAPNNASWLACPATVSSIPAEGPAVR